MINQIDTHGSKCPQLMIVKIVLGMLKTWSCKFRNEKNERREENGGVVATNIVIAILDIIASAYFILLFTFFICNLSTSFNHFYIAIYTDC